MDSDDLSLETTAPTDLSISGDETTIRKQKERKRAISKQLIERKQLLHDLQVLKIELSQKSLQIDNLKAEHLHTNEELEDKLNAALHEKNILQAKLEAQLKIQQDESKRRQEVIKRELDTILARQQQLELTNQKLQEKAGNVRRSLVDLDVTAAQYRELKSQNEDQLTLRDYFSVKLYEALFPWKNENVEMKSRLKILSNDVKKYKDEKSRYIELLEEEKRQHHDLQMKQQRLTLTLADTQAQVHQGNYKVENYDHVKKERDDLESELLDLKKEHAYLESSYKATVAERDGLSSEMTSAKQSISLLTQDKTFYSRQVTDYSSKLSYAEERIVQLNDQLEKAKQSREELYEKYVASRDEYKSQYELKLHEELEKIRTKTSSEVDRLKTSTREMFERENRNLREAREMAASERDRALAAEKETHAKYEQLVEDLRHIQSTTDNKLSEVQNEVKIKTFEAERTQLVYEETVRTLKEAQLELEKKQGKLDVLTKEYYTQQTTLEKQVTELESALRERNVRLETYEKLEQELDDVVMQAADVEKEEDAEKVLFSYGYGSNVPTTSKRRLQHSVHLARRVLSVERANTSLQKDLEREIAKNVKLAEELRNTNALLDESQQPSHYLIESLRTRDRTIAALNKQIVELQTNIKKLQQEAEKLSKGKNQMSSDLERLLNQQEEMSVLRQAVHNLAEKRRAGKEIHLKKSKSTTSLPTSTTTTTKVHSKARLSSTTRPASKPAPVETKTLQPLAERDENVYEPKPMKLVSDEMPQWYDKMKKKSKVGQ